MSQCGDRSLKFGKLCFSSDDYYMIIFNLFMFLIIATIIYFKNIAESRKNLTVNLKYNFTPFGEGNLNNFYSSLGTQLKNPNIKKKVQTKTLNQSQVPVEKVINNNELKCNSCGRSVELSYQYTTSKINAFQ